MCGVVLVGAAVKTKYSADAAASGRVARSASSTKHQVSQSALPETDQKPRLRLLVRETAHDAEFGYAARARLGVDSSAKVALDVGLQPMYGAGLQTMSPEFRHTYYVR